MAQYTILFVDDDADILRTLGNYFEKLGHVVHRAASGKEGLALHERAHPDVTVLDLFMPEMSGMEVLEVLRKRGAMVIMLTGRGEIEAAVQAMQLGAENFLSKPIEMSHLQAAVEKAAEKAVLRSENIRLRRRAHPSLKRRLTRAAVLVLLVAASAIAGRLIGGARQEAPPSPIPVPFDSLPIQPPDERPLVPQSP